MIEVGVNTVSSLRDLRELQRTVSCLRLRGIANTVVAAVDITATRLCDNGDGHRAPCCVLAPRQDAAYLCIECADRTAQGWASASPDEFTTIAVAW